MILMKSDVRNFPCKRGKVRDVYDIGNDRLVIVATDRISAFDWVFAKRHSYQQGIVFLTGLTKFWMTYICGLFSQRFASHFISDKQEDMPGEFGGKEFAGRTMLVRKCTPYPVECIVRGYLAGSGWTEYKQTGFVSGIRLPCGLQQSMPLCDPIFTPSTKAETGHDENITFDQMASIIAPMCPEPESGCTNVGMGRITASRLHQHSCYETHTGGVQVRLESWHHYCRHEV